METTSRTEAGIEVIEALFAIENKLDEETRSCSSRKSSVGSLKAPWTHTMATPIRVAEMIKEATLVKNITVSVAPTKTARISLFDSVWPRRINGCSDGLKK